MRLPLVLSYLAAAIQSVISFSLPPFTSLHPSVANHGNLTSEIGIPRFYPWRFDVPNSAITLRLSLGLLTVDKRELGTFLGLVTDEVRRQITIHGLDGIPPDNSWHVRVPSLRQPHRDWKVFSLGTRHPPRITWGILKDVLEGLRLYLVDGNRNRQAYFKIERRVEGNLELLGLGGLYIDKNP